MVLTATAISFGNEWVNQNKVNFRIPVAGFGVALLFDGIEKISPQAAMGLATITLITVLFAPIGGKSPAQTLADLTVAKPSGPTLVHGANGVVTVSSPLVDASGKSLVK